MLRERARRRDREDVVDTLVVVEKYLTTKHSLLNSIRLKIYRIIYVGVHQTHSTEGDTDLSSGRRVSVGKKPHWHVVWPIRLSVCRLLVRPLGILGLGLGCDGVRFSGAICVDKWTCIQVNLWTSVYEQPLWSQFSFSSLIWVNWLSLDSLNSRVTLIW